VTEVNLSAVFFIKNRFHVSVTLHTLSPENRKQYFQAKIERLNQEQRIQTNSRMKFKSVNPNISCSHYNTGKYVISK